ncbi:sensor histidine kinase [Phytohabitans suffuscus]|uniref:Signal transduction histidine kinase subgroup 3 dimerisation and phosphoacceptor domain-containing protein n=1 Tax=Phytohabitans suffuscus TaxID=624315 RepID=A0A6F8YA70_9ACTN|nr:hypothetical protein [Phytohabitans suffuscus]BCB83012.1 hypothetical protein Psuf_003250 [Phytohabitans suffuscus]
MTGLLRRAWLALSGRAAGRDRWVLAVGITVRLAAVVMLLCALPLIWHRLPYPGWSVLLVLALTAETAAVVTWWLWRGRITAGPLVLDVLTGVLALAVCPILNAPHAVVGWTGFPYPHTVLVSFTYGLAPRRLWPAVAGGAALAATSAAGSVAIDQVSLGHALLAVPGFLVNPTVGWLTARLMRRTSDQVESARTQAVAAAADLATARERNRHARALHDRVLQTMETLARGRTVAPEALRAQVVDQAAWLRHFVETGQASDDEDLPAGLAAATRAAVRAGVTVRLNDARLRLAAHPGVGDLPRERRDALVSAVHHTLTAIAGASGEVIVHAAPDRGGVLVTVLATGPAPPPSPDDVTELEQRLAPVGGRVVVEALPYVELWVPARPRGRAGAPP